VACFPVAGVIRSAASGNTGRFDGASVRLERAAARVSCLAWGRPCRRSCARPSGWNRCRRMVQRSGRLSSAAGPFRMRQRSTARACPGSAVPGRRRGERGSAWHHHRNGARRGRPNAGAAPAADGASRAGLGGIVGALAAAPGARARRRPAAACRALAVESISQRGHAVRRRTGRRAPARRDERGAWSRIRSNADRNRWGRAWRKIEA